MLRPEGSLNYFTGVSYSCFINEAKVFRTERGAATAARYWQTADHNPTPLPKPWFDGRRVVPVKLAVIS